MTAVREELALRLHLIECGSGCTDYTGKDDDEDTSFLATADALIKAGYSKPRTITTAEEVRCLPSGSFFTDSNGRGYIAMRSGPRRGYFGENAPEDGWAIPDLTSLPFTVHFVPPFAS